MENKSKIYRNLKYDPADYFLDYDFSKEVEEIDKKCLEYEKKLTSLNKISKPVEKTQYGKFTEKLKESIKNKDYMAKPGYLSEKYVDFNCDKTNKVSKITKFQFVSPMELYYKMNYESFHKISHDEDRCTICMDNLYEITKETPIEDVLDLENRINNKLDVLLLNKCNDHFFHLDCISNMIGSNDYIRCPVCSKIYGIQTGTQPPGNMTAYLDKEYKCEGYEKYDTIIINYYFPHGSGYSGTARQAFLPNNTEGRKVLGLLKVCFDRKLIFTVGTSVTTGMQNTTVWAGIHHKTSLGGGTMYFGYPDPTYFNRVLEEMAAKGVTEDSLDQSAESIADNFLKQSRGKKK
jgi:deltex-like protein